MSAAARVRLLAVAAIVVTALAAAFDGWGNPSWYALPVLAVVVGAAEVAVVHLSFGRQRWTFSLTEAAIAVAFVHSPRAWTVLAVTAGVLVAQLIRRQDPLKVLFNVAQFAAATALGAGFAALVGAGVPGAIGGMGVFWFVNNLLIASAMSMMTDQKLRSLLWASAPLASIHSVGTSGIGILAAWLAANAPLGLLALVIPLLLLWISYDEQTTCGGRGPALRRAGPAAGTRERPVGRRVGARRPDRGRAAVRQRRRRDGAARRGRAGRGTPATSTGSSASGSTPRRSTCPGCCARSVSAAQSPATTTADPGARLCSAATRRRSRCWSPGDRSVASGFGRREMMLAEVLVQQAESWLSIAELAASRDEALAHAEAAEDAARALGDLGADTAPSLVVLRESANRLARLAATEGPASVHEIVDELYAVERAVASLLGAIALAAEPDLGAGSRSTTTRCRCSAAPRSGRPRGC